MASLNHENTMGQSDLDCGTETQENGKAVFNNNRSKEEEEQLNTWDRFKISPPSDDEDSYENGICYRITIQSAKIFVYLLTFFVVLGGILVAKSSLFLMTSQLQPDKAIGSCSQDPNSTAWVFSKGPPIPIEEKIYWTWMIMFAFWLPEFMTFFRSVRIWIFKRQEKPTRVQFLVLFFMETCHTIGLGLFVYIVLPGVDVTRGAALMTTVCIAPAILGFLSRRVDESRKRLIVLRTLDVVSVLFQISALGVWVTFPEKGDQRSVQNLWVLPISILLISFGWWNNYIDALSAFSCMQRMAQIKQDLLKTGYLSYTFISIWKILVFFGLSVLTFEMTWGNCGDLFSKMGDAFNFRVSEKLDPIEITNGLHIFQHPLLYHVLSAFLCYGFGRYACKICIQHFSFALPLTLAFPVTIGALIFLCRQESCLYPIQSPFFGILTWTCPKITMDYFNRLHVFIWLSWFLSQTWITIHIWFPGHGEQLSLTELIFTTPKYNSLFIDQSLALNRRRNDEDNKLERRGLGMQFFQRGRTVEDLNRRKSAPKIFACATMWHETKEEMMNLLKSTFRMDSEHQALNIARKLYSDEEIKYFDYETHVFFDDAFVSTQPSNDKSPKKLNKFVQLFIHSLAKVTELVHAGLFTLEPPKTYLTPYGGRIKWVLPGNTNLILHLKDSSKIRHKKRWSQVMYMYYLLGFRNVDAVEGNNTFLLALDGDVDFRPKAVELLVDLMKRNSNVGAACGRIHPTGVGPLVWFQKFEYAIGHWFQKATEHMIGCVLCAPGCFSLFRASALMSNNVLAKYASTSEEALDYIQFDQGEDRWLCTLILQQGYKIEYCAASDAMTHAPEEFNEFYNQRRRWIPSTTANILNLLMDYKRTIQIHPDISRYYIIYQSTLLVGSIVGPGTILLMLVGVYTTIFEMSHATSFVINIIPLITFSLVCHFWKSESQLKVARILTVYYILVMVTVSVGVMVIAAKEGFSSPSFIFLSFITTIFILAAILHPQEFDCLVCGIVYFITIPAMYFYLIIYSVFNLDDVSWGTRESSEVKERQQMEYQTRQGSRIHESFFDSEFCVWLKKVFCCGRDCGDEEQLITLAKKLDKLDEIERKLKDLTTNSGESGSTSTPQPCTSESTSTTQLTTNSVTTTQSIVTEEPTVSDEDPNNPEWMQDPCLEHSVVNFLDQNEIKFWKVLSIKYLSPLSLDLEKKEELKIKLKSLRNKCILYFFLLNSIFVLLIFLMELEKDYLSLPWFGKNTIGAPIRLEPIGTLFLLFFALVLIIQFLAMLFHRFETFSHILSSTTLFFTKPFLNSEDVNDSVESTQIVNSSDTAPLMRSIQENSPTPSRKDLRREEIDQSVKLIQDLSRRSIESIVETGEMVETQVAASGQPSRTSVKRAVQNMEDMYRINTELLEAMSHKKQIQVFGSENATKRFNRMTELAKANAGLNTGRHSGNLDSSNEQPQAGPSRNF